MAVYIGHKHEIISKVIVNNMDRELLALLSANSRESTSELARKLKLSRSTVKSRIERLERQGVITGYTIRFSEAFTQGQIQAHVMISSNPKQSSQIIRTLQKMAAIKSVYAVNGIFDMLAIVSSDSIGALDQALDHIGGMPGVEKTVSSIILATKFER